MNINSTRNRKTVSRKLFNDFLSLTLKPSARSTVPGLCPGRVVLIQSRSSKSLLMDDGDKIFSFRES